MAELRSHVRSIIYDYINNKINDEIFKVEIRKTIVKFGNQFNTMNLLYQNIGEIILAGMKNGLTVDQYEKIKQLLNQVEPKIEKQFEHWKKKLEE